VFVCILPRKAVPEMTHAVSSGTLNPTHLLIHQVVASISDFALSRITLAFAMVVTSRQHCLWKKPFLYEAPDI